MSDVSQKRYTGQYLKLYVWQTASIVLNFFVFFLITPHIASNTELFGIYTICVSLTIFVSYADLGFVSAGYKYASEMFAKAEFDNESRLLGFVLFMMMMFLLPYMVLLLVFAYNPQLIVQGLDAASEQTASRLFTIVACTTPFLVLQRIAQVVYGVRVAAHVLRALLVTANIVTLAVSPLFLRHDNINIVGYYLFLNLMQALATVAALLIAQRKAYRFLLIDFLRNIRFSSETFRNTRALAFTSLSLTVGWIVFYELDSIVISRLLGVEQLAIYGVCLTLANFLRSLAGVLFSPFGARFNHFVAFNNERELKLFFRRIISLTTVPVILSVTALLLMMKPFIISWVGPQYERSVFMAMLLCASYLWASFQYPGGMLLIALKRIKVINVLNISMVVLFWFGVLFTIHSLGVYSFALWKFVSFSVCGVGYLVIAKKYLDISLFHSLLKIGLPLLPGVAFVAGANYLVSSYLPLVKGKQNLLLVVLTLAVTISLGVLITYFTSADFRWNVGQLTLGHAKRRVRNAQS